MADLQRSDSTRALRVLGNAVRLAATLVAAAVVYPVASFIILSVWMVVL